MADADKQIIIQYMVQGKEAIKNAEEIRAKLEVIKQQIKDLASQSKSSFKDIAEGMKQAFKQQTLFPDGKKLGAADINKAKQAVSDYNKVVNTALKEVQSEAGKTSQSFLNLGTVSKFVFGTVLGLSVVQVLRKIVDGLKQAAQSGYELVKSMYQLSVGINVLRRSGVEITIQDMYENIDKLGKRFGIFSQKELIQGSAALVNLIRDFGFTKEQIFSLQEAISTLAVINGRAMDDVQRTVALALSSGYTEGLQRLGVSINRVTIAQEAARLGYEGNYLALTEVQRAEATYNLVLEKTAKYSDDLARYQETAAGKIDTLTASWTDLVSYIGSAVIPAMADVSEWFTDWISKANDYYQTLVKIREEGVVPKDTQLPPQVEAELTGQRITRIPKNAPDRLYDLFVDEEKVKKSKDALIELFPAEEIAVAVGNSTSKIESTVSEHLEDIEELEKKSKEKRLEYEKDFDRDIEKLIRESDRRQLEIVRDHQRDLADIELEGHNDRLDLWQDYTDKLNQIEMDLGRDIAEENAKYALDVAQTVRQFAIRKAELEARYRENEKKAEIRFQEEMRKLREGFLFDLEDALHERDARQILRLIRQYNLQRAQAQRQFDIDKEERAREYKIQLEELETQKNERLRVLAEEHAARIAAIQAQAAYERELAWQKHQQELADLDKQLEEKKAKRDRQFEEDQAELEQRLRDDKEERKILLDQQLEDLEAERTRLLTEIGEKLWGALQETTDAGLKTLYDALVAALGEGGSADEVFDYYVGSAEHAMYEVEGSMSRVAGALARLYAFAASLQGLESSIPSIPFGSANIPTQGQIPTSGNRQSGGPVYEGEVYRIHKDETFVPAVNGTILSKQQSQEALVNALGRGARSGMGEGRATIEVMLQPGLVAKIVDDALDQTANILISQMRKN